LKRHLAGIGDVRAGRPHVLILFRPTESELDIEYCKWLTGSAIIISHPPLGGPQPALATMRQRGR
jgi:hypothetical protein